MCLKVIILLATFYFVNGIFFTGNKYLLEKFRKAAELLRLDSVVETKWIKQPVNHFNTTETREWNMKYFQNLDKWKPGGPIYLYINGEGDASSDSLMTGLMYDLAVETNGAMLGSEHRYYGESKPFDIFTTENLQYLSSRQALADIAKLIKEFKTSPSFNSSKVIVVGGSYAGNLAAWMRLIYPDLIDAAISSSAPVLAKVDYYEYLETVGDDFKKYATSECFDKLSAKFNRYRNLLKTESGIIKLKIEENICEDTDFSKWENQALFFSNSIGEYAMAAQYGSPDDIRDLCDGLDEGSHAFNSNGKVRISDKKNDCLDYEFNNIFRPNIPKFPWSYQMCTEFGYFLTSPKNQPFVIPVYENFYSKVCSASFGLDFNESTIAEAVKKTNIMYGGLNPNVTNVVFVNGEIDPWHRLSIVEDLSEKAPAIMIPRASHHNDLAYGDNDTEEVKKAREEEKRLIKKWIT